MRIFVAGAAGAIGQRLVPQLVAAGHQVTASTRRPDGQARLRAMGAEPAVMDGLDPAAVGEAVARARPEVVIHQMTALAAGTDLRHFDRSFAVTNRLRTEGTDHLLAAATAAGARRFIAQGFTGWSNIRSGGPVKTEQDPLDPDPPANQRQTLAALRYLENAVTGAPGLEGIVLRYGALYGPGTANEVLGFTRQRKLPLVGEAGGVWSFLHTDDAAAATVAALTRGRPGVYNITDDEPAKVADWLPWLARELGAKPPMRLPVWLARLAAGEVAVSVLTQIRGSSNAKARAELDWVPSWASWRQGFLAVDGAEQAGGPAGAARAAGKASGGMDSGGMAGGGMDSGGHS
jgi:nucleoside-diphosphate-sugar epimerase